MNRSQKRDQFIDNLEKFREAHGYNGTEFARILNVKKQQWGRWKNGKMGMTLDTAYQLVEQLNKQFKRNWTLRNWLLDEVPEV